MKYHFNPETGEYTINEEEAAPVEVKHLPEMPWPIWDDRPIDADRAMAAVRALSGG
jgi:hypothetical protein